MSKNKLRKVDCGRKRLNNEWYKKDSFFLSIESRKVKTQAINCEKYFEIVEKHSFAVATRLEVFQNRKIDFQAFAHPLDLAVENIPSCFQLKIIELQENVDFKRAYNENGLPTFYKHYVYGNYKNLENHTKK